MSVLENTPQDILYDLIISSSRRLSNDDEDDDEAGTWEDIAVGEKVTIILITLFSILLCLYFCYYIKCRKALPTDRIPLTSPGANGLRYG